MCWPIIAGTTWQITSQDWINWHHKKFQQMHWTLGPPPPYCQHHQSSLDLVWASIQSSLTQIDFASTLIVSNSESSDEREIFSSAICKRIFASWAEHKFRPEKKKNDVFPQFELSTASVLVSCNPTNMWQQQQQQRKIKTHKWIQHCLWPMCTSVFVMCKNRKKKGARQQCDHFQWWRVPRMQQGWDAGQ